MTMETIKSKIRTIPDFPEEGVMFRDITTLLKDAQGFRQTIDAFVNRYQPMEIDVVAGIEARGFIIAGAIACLLGTGFIPIRKPGKLPGEVISVEYDLEYGKDGLEIHADAFPPGTRVLIVDDVMATGGTISAAIELTKKLGGQVVGLAFLIEHNYLGGREKLADYDIAALVQYDD